MKIWEETGNKTTGMAVLLMLVFAFVAAAPGVGAATAAMDFSYDGVLLSPAGPEFINNNGANLTMTVLTAAGVPFNTTNVATANQTNVTAQFRNSLGVAQDITGDGSADTFEATENSTRPGVWEIVGGINTSAMPGEYTLYLSAIAKNTTTDTIIQEANQTISAYVADPYWVSMFAKEGEDLTILNYNIGLESINTLGAVLKLGTTTLGLSTLTPDTTTGVMSAQVDILGDGTADDWLFVESAGSSGLSTVKIYSKKDIIPAVPESIIKVSGDTVTRTEWLKNGDDYRQMVLWDQSPTAWIKADDYYIIPAKGGAHWSESRGTNYIGDASVIKRTTYLSMLSSEQELFDGNILQDTFESVNDELTLIGVRASNSVDLGNNIWEMVQGVGQLTYPSSYEMQYRDAAVPADLKMRGSMVYSGLGASEWNAMVIQNT